MRFRALPCLWLAPLALAPFAGSVGTEVVVAGGLVGLGMIELVSHLSSAHAKMQRQRYQGAFNGTSRELSNRIRLAVTVRYTHLTALMEKALENAKHPLARRRERSDSREWIDTQQRWNEVANHLRARAEALRECLRIQLGLHQIVYRGASDWACYLDFYHNRSEPQEAMETFMPPTPRIASRAAWWLAVAGATAAIAVGWTLPHLDTTTANSSVFVAGAGLIGLAISTLTAWGRASSLKATEAIDAEFVKARIEEAVAPEVRREIAEAFEHDVSELVRLLAEWTHPDTDRRSRP